MSKPECYGQHLQAVILTSNIIVVTANGHLTSNTYPDRRYCAGNIITIYPVINIDAVNAAIEILKKDKRVRSHFGKCISQSTHYTDSTSVQETQVKVTLFGQGQISYCSLSDAFDCGWIMGNHVNNSKRGEDLLSWNIQSII